MLPWVLLVSFVIIPITLAIWITNIFIAIYSDSEGVFMHIYLMVRCLGDNKVISHFGADGP